MADPYCTLAEADVFLALDYDNWIALSDDEKNDALFWGRVYIDSVYTCEDDDGDAYDDTTAPDALKRANAIAANAHSQGLIFDKEKEVSEVSVQAGDVSSTKKYVPQSSSSTHIAEVSQIKALLKDICDCQLGTSGLSRV